MNPNFMQMAMQMVQSGRNPMGMLQGMMGSNPQLAQAMRMIQGRSPQELRKVAENMAKERGIDLEQVAQGLGIKLPQ